MHSSYCKHLTTDHIKNMETRYRAKLINSLSGFKSANLIATKNTTGQTNLAIVSSVIHLGSDPALIGYITRPASTQRDTLNNIITTEKYTINQISSDFWQAGHQTSARYAENESEFKHVGLTEQYIENFSSPFVKESKLKYALTLADIIPIPANNTQLIIGQVTDILCTETAIKSDGYIDIERLNTTCISSLDSYHTTIRLGRLSYAKPNKKPKLLTIDGKTIDGEKNE